MQFKLRTLAFLVAAVAVVMAACVADSLARQQINLLEDRNCTVFCTTTGPEFIRTIFAPNFGKSVSLVVLQRDDLTQDAMGAGLPVIFARIDDELVDRLNDVDAKVYGTSEQFAAIRQRDEKLELLNFEDAYKMARLLGAFSCEPYRTLHTSLSHLFCTTFSVLAAFSVIGWATNRLPRTTRGITKK